MDAELKNSILKTGTTTIGIVCKDGIVIAADRQSSFGGDSGVSYIGGSHMKIHEVTPNVIVTTAGHASDSRRVIKLVKAETKLKELKSKFTPTVKQIANLFSSISYQSIRQPSMIPSVAHFLLGGYDDSGYHLYDIFPDGFLEKIEKYSVSGSGMPHVNPILDSDYEKDIDIKQGVKLAKKGLRASIGRDPASGLGIDIFTITKDGIKKVVEQEILPEYRDKK